LAVSDELHAASAVRSWVLPSEKRPVARSWMIVPGAMPGTGGEISMDARLAFVTCTVAEPLLPDRDAVISAEPATSPLASPLSEMVTVAGSDDDQVTWDVMSPVVSSS
jgi:hypothetical protein